MTSVAADIVEQLIFKVLNRSTKALSEGQLTLLQLPVANCPLLLPPSIDYASQLTLHLPTSSDWAALHHSNCYCKHRAKTLINGEARLATGGGAESLLARVTG